MTCYSAHGLGHRILTRLQSGPQYVEGFRADDLPIKKLNHGLIALQADGLIVLTRMGYEITTSGLRTLAELAQSGSSVDPSRRGGPERSRATVGQAVPSDADPQSQDRPRREMPASSSIPAEAESSVRVYGMRAQG